MKKGKLSRSVFVAEDFFIMRSPLLPVRALADLGHECRAASCWREGAARERLAVSFAQDCASVRNGMLSLLEDPTLREALFVSSASLMGNLDHWHRRPLSRKGASVERSVLKYLTRAATRCTPYGQLAGVAMGEIGSGRPTALRIGPKEQHRRHARIDSGCLLNLAARVANDRSCRARLIYFPNSTWYQLGGRVRYFEADDHPFAGKDRLISVAGNEVVTGILQCARSGASWDELISETRRLEPEAGAGEAEEFLQDLVDSQLLVPDVFPSTMSDNMLEDLRERLAYQVPDHPVCTVLAEFTRMTGELNETPVGQGTALLEHAAEAIGGTAKAADENTEDASGDDEEAAASNRLQVDMTLAASELEINEAHLRPVHAALECLYRINAQAVGSAMKSFVDEFIRRYDTREVPLVRVLDPDGGIRFGTVSHMQAEPSPLLGVPILPFAGTASGQEDKTAAWKTQLLVDAARNDSHTIELKAEDIRKRFRQPPIRPMASTTALISAVRSGGESAREEPSWLLLRTSGANGLAYMGRFAHVLGDRLTERLKRCAAREQAADDSLLAEVCYLPPDRLGNVCQQPSFRGHSIAYKSPPRRDGREPIRLDDLMVSIRAGQIVLTLRSSGQRVSPRVDHMLNVGHRTSPAVFNFLGMLQGEGMQRGLEWNWGSLSQMPDLPRVSIEGVVVSPRTWTLTASDTERLKRDQKKDSFQETGLDLFIAVQEWRRERSVPRWVAVGNMTDYMVFDLENPMSVDLFLREIKRMPVVRETFVNERSAAVDGPHGGGHVNEIVLPIWDRQVVQHAKDAGSSRSSEASATAVSAPSARSRPVASALPEALRICDGVLYAKIYGGSAVLDKALRNDLGRLAAEMQRAKLIDTWFFIRYADPDFHLRVRFFGTPDVLGREVLGVLERNFDRKRNPGLWRLQFDAYEPEYERYGGERGVRLAEQLFDIDSRTMIPMMRLLDVTEHPRSENSLVGTEARWLLAAVSADSLLGDLGLDLAARLAFTEAYGNALAQEFAFGKHQRQAVGQLHREHRQVLSDALTSPELASLPWLKPVRQILAQRSHLIRSWRRSLEEGLTDGSVGATYESLLQSYVHMHCNRMFASQMRRQETVLLQLLQRHYRSEISRRQSESASQRERSVS